MSVILASVAGSFCLLQDVQANTPIFVYGGSDLMLCFRKDGNDGLGTIGQNVIEVDIGAASTYYGAAIGSTVPVTHYSTSLLGAFDSINDLSWSVSGCVPYAGFAGDTNSAETLWVTDPRPAAQMLAAPWVANGANGQALAANEIASIEFNAGQYSAGVSSGAQNTGTAIVIPVGQTPDFSCDANLGSEGNFNGRFQGIVETITPPDFTSGTESPSRADFYGLTPSTGGAHPAGTYLGYFELKSNGSMVFYRLAGPPPIISVSVADGTSTISFQTAVGATYTLYYTNATGLSSPVNTWTKYPTTVSGDGTVKSFQVPAAGANTFYSVQDH
jgi:hypothetical protein